MQWFSGRLIYRRGANLEQACSALFVPGLACTTTPDHPECSGPASLILEGEVDGEIISVTYSTGGYAWLNALSGNGSAAVNAEGGALIVAFSFDELISHGGTSGANGYLDLSSLGGIQIGNCSEDGNVSSVTSYKDGFGFELVNLRRPLPTVEEQRQRDPFLGVTVRRTDG